MRKRFALTKNLFFFAILSALFMAVSFGCGELGQVDQGRVIVYDKEKREVTLIQDRNFEDPHNPDYSILPPHTYKIPDDPGEMGPEPKQGKRMKMDKKKNQIVIFDMVTQDFKTIDYKLIDQKEKVDAKDVLVYDKAADKAKKFPVVDREKKTITVYSKRLQTLVTFTVPDEYFAMPDDTWDAGDEVRVYYKEPGKALRLMNISKTDIFKK